jgi:hypothetical protein
MPPRIRIFFASLTAVLFLIPGVAIYRELATRADIWWTPHAMLIPLTESRERVEIYVRGRPIEALLEAGQLRIADQTGLSALAANEVGLRLNNWDRVRAERRALLLAYAGALGAGVMLLLLWVTGRLAYRDGTARLLPN